MCLTVIALHAIHLPTFTCLYTIIVSYRRKKWLSKRCSERKARQHNTTERQSNSMQLTHGSYSKKKLPRYDSNP